MTGREELLLAERPCAQCLTTRSRIVSGERAAEIIAGCRTDQRHFFCHKRSGVHCRGVHDLMLKRDGGSIAYRLAKLIGVPVREVDTNAQPPYEPARR